MATAILERPAETTHHYNLRKIVVAYDASPSAERALNDAAAIGRCFHSEIVLAQAMPPGREPSLPELRCERVREVEALDRVRGRHALNGLSSRSILRGGIVGDTLFSICCDEDADLLLLGAYGFGLQDRQTLGSTAEYLLRALPCPVLTYGPRVSVAFDPSVHRGPVLVPISLPCDQWQLRRAAEITKLFGVRLEVLHVAEHMRPVAVRELEHQCEQLAERLRRSGVHAQWSLYCGAPDAVISARAREIDSPFILMPLRWGHRLSSLASDNVVAHVIRRSVTPVMTYRIA